MCYGAGLLADVSKNLAVSIIRMKYFSICLFLLLFNMTVEQADVQHDNNV
jgi:hypothetical protein